MPLIYIETTPLTKTLFECSQTWIEAGINTCERFEEIEADSRMSAAMTNLGKACRWLADSNIQGGAVCIATDRDGRDLRYSGEHDALFDAVQDRTEYQKNRQAYIPLYGKYVAYLDRIRLLVDEWYISFTQNDKEIAPPEYHATPESEIMEKLLEYGKGNHWTLKNIVSIDLNGKENAITCNACHRRIVFRTTGKFKSFRTISGLHRYKYIKGKEFIKYFTEKHLHEHNPTY